MLYRLIVKLPCTPGEIEARLPGSMVLSHRYGDRWLSATVYVPSPDELTRWFVEFGKFEEHRGFEPGTLLFYAPEN